MNVKTRKFCEILRFPTTASKLPVFAKLLHYRLPLAGVIKFFICQHTRETLPTHQNIVLRSTWVMSNVSISH